MIALGEGPPVPFEYRTPPTVNRALNYGDVGKSTESRCNYGLLNCGTCAAAAENAVQRVQRLSGMFGRGTR
jgi:hypothetical protein